eukprot:g12131.t1
MTDIDCGSYGTLTDGVCECVLGWAGTLCDQNEIYMTVLNHTLDSWWFWSMIVPLLAFCIWLMTYVHGDHEGIYTHTTLSAIITVCCIGNTILLGWEHMIAAGAWDW